MTNCRKKKMLLLLMSMLFLFVNHQNGLLADSIAVFKQKDAKSQAEFINSLSKQEKFGFLKKFLPGSCFYAPLNIDMKFLSDGSALSHAQGYFYTRWHIANNTFKIWKEKPSDPYPEDKNEYVLTDLTAEGGDSLWLVLSNSKDEGLSFQYSPECMGYFIVGDSLYENYKKSLTPKERARLEKLNPPVKPSAIVDDKQPTISNYAGFYDFGDSEHWTLTIVVVDGRPFIQSTDLLPSPDNDKWQLKCYNFEDVEIHENNMTAKTVTGRFVIATYEGKNKTGLMLKWKQGGKEEFGYKYSTSFPGFLNGKYPETYLKRLDERDLAGKTKQDLKIMRNEIYARYGYRFRPNGSMDHYFRSQSWYDPLNVDVDKCLTEIEKENIEFIIKHE